MITAGIVIIGAGQAAAVAAHTLREHGWQGPIKMLGRERHRPYERPPLSKAVLRSSEPPELDVLRGEAWDRAAIDFQPETEVVALYPSLRQVRLADGRVLAYDKCLLATGGEAITLASLPRSHPRVHYLRTVDDARRLQGALGSRPAVVVLGAGFLGLEVAYSCLAAGASVRLIERATSLLDRFVPPEVSQWLAVQVQEAGACLQLGTAVAGADLHAPEGIALTTDTGVRVCADDMVVAVGLSPNDALARAAGLDVAAGGGVLVDVRCRTSDENIFACGDCTSQQRSAGTQPTRLESWQNANEQARTAAAAMLGATAPAPRLPWFWTDQGRHNLQILGTPGTGIEYVRRGNPAKGRAVWLGLVDRVPVHAVALNAPSELRALRPLLERACAVDRDEFTHDSTTLRAWVNQQLAGPALAAI